MLLTMLTFQLAGTQTPPPLVRGLDTFDLAQLARSRTACAQADPGNAGSDIVVCGHRKAMDAQLPPIAFTERPIRAETRLFNAVPTSLHVEQRTVAGVTAPALMIAFKIPF